MQSGLATPVRLRFAPSPTGFPHLGNIRTALFNWLFARHHGGKLILRIEDTDVARKVEGAVEAIISGLQWLGLDWDEGPYFQSQRTSNYRDIAYRLVEEGQTYLCYCSPERLEAMRQEQAQRKQPPKYDGRCRDLDRHERAERETSGASAVVRFKTPLEGTTTVHDLIRGPVTFKHETLDDFILLKSDGYPTYHLANVIDDHLMAISHVVRGDEWLSSTPRHVLLYGALNWQPPQFAHLPMILGPDRSKLSKRHGAATITEYQEQGYLPEAMTNFLALLGWSLDDRTELLTREELVKHFSLDRVGKTGAVFDKGKLEWMNGVYMRRLSLADFAGRAIPYLERDLPAPVPRPLDHQYASRVLALVHERARTLGEVPELCSFFFVEELEYDARLLLGQDLDARATAEAIKTVLLSLEGAADWSAGPLEDTLRPLAGELGLSTRDLFGLLRVAVTGRTAAPPLFQTMAVLGKQKCLERLTEAHQLLSGLS